MSDACTALRVRVKQEALKILKFLSSMDFNECYPLTKEFKELPRQPGLYAIRDRVEVIYLGRALNLRDRFKTGHTAILSAFIDGAVSTDLRIAVVTVSPYGLQAWTNSKHG